MSIFILKYNSLSVFYFWAPQVYPATVTLLTDEQLKELGVSRMGDRADLRTRCKNVQRCKPMLLQLLKEPIIVWNACLW